ncbi:hypothetical protein B0H16DRAFT_1838017 [Mycena metata]|uniref:Uncharacterized protein n=1 Tax=Mycena metata TaxID=1033252 RepID=A0AAD7NX69_9AGAR|nr:hypothetical protein B0H16DRAFT_1838017 [Mycena metata]
MCNICCRWLAAMHRKNRAEETTKPTRHRCQLAALDNWIEGGETSVGVDGAVAGDIEDDTDAKIRRRTGMGRGACACGSQLQDFEMIFRVVDGLEGQDLKFEAVREDMELIQAQRAMGVEESVLRTYTTLAVVKSMHCSLQPSVVICCNRMQDGSWKEMGDDSIRESVETELWAVVGKDLEAQR